MNDDPRRKWLEEYSKRINEITDIMSKNYFRYLKDNGRKPKDTNLSEWNFVEEIFRPEWHPIRQEPNPKPRFTLEQRKAMK